ncbi:MAG: hypothetical protein C0596_00925 [Marinilabiliales bacterium]|nr:MAG: hypothetical protein C0596_00925 [Marinilabiliales bacterium]
MNGKQVYFGKIVNKNSRVSFKELPTGVYILRLNLDGEISNHKLIKQ